MDSLIGKISSLPMEKKNNDEEIDSAVFHQNGSSSNADTIENSNTVNEDDSVSNTAVSASDMETNPSEAVEEMNTDDVPQNLQQVDQLESANAPEQFKSKTPDASVSDSPLSKESEVAISKIKDVAERVENIKSRIELFEEKVDKLNMEELENLPIKLSINTILSITF